MEFSAYCNSPDRIDSLSVDCIGTDIDISTAKSGIAKARETVPTAASGGTGVAAVHYTDFVSLVQGDMFQTIDLHSQPQSPSSSAYGERPGRGGWEADPGSGRFCLPMPLILVCYLSREGNRKLQQLLTGYGVHQTPTPGHWELTVLSVGVSIASGVHLTSMSHWLWYV